METQFVLITRQPGAIGAPEVNAYLGSPDQTCEQLEQIGQDLAAGATPPMSIEILPLQPATFDAA